MDDYKKDIHNSFTSNSFTYMNETKYIGVPRDYQQTAIDYVINNNVEGCVMKMPTGQGKTYVALGIVAKRNLKTLIVVHNNPQANMWKKAIRESFTGIEIGELSGDCIKDGDIVVGIINTVALKSGNDEIVIGSSTRMTFNNYLKLFSFVIYDECHKFCSPQFSNAYRRTQTHYMMGLSATPLESVFGQLSVWYLGPIIDVMADIPNYKPPEQKYNGVIHLIHFMGHPDHTKTYINERTQRIDHHKSLNQIMTDKARLEFICNCVKLLNDDKKQIFIFAEWKKYLVEIHDTLQVLGINSTILVGGAQENEMEYVVADENVNVILTTYPFLGTGFSLPRMDAIIFATPRKSMFEQYVGRIFREANDVDRTIIDIVDYKTSLKSQLKQRLEVYNNQKKIGRNLELHKCNVFYNALNYDWYRIV